MGGLQIDAVDAISPSRITVADAHAAGYDSKAQALRNQAKYAQPDRRLDPTSVLLPGTDCQRDASRRATQA